MIRRAHIGCAIAALASGLTLTASAAHEAPARRPPAPAPVAAPYDPAIETQTTIGDGFTFVATGDLIYPLPLADWQEPGFQDALKVIRAGDVAYGNLEMNVIDIDDFQGAMSNGGFIGAPDMVADLKRLGFDAVGRANNHLYDYGMVGMLETNDHLEKGGIVYAGSGKSYGAARAARFLMTPKGRVGFVAASTSHSPTFTSLPTVVRAQPESGELPGRPGVSQLATTQIYVVPPKLADALRIIKQAFPTGGALYAPTGETATRFSAMGQTFQVADVDAPQFTYETDKADEAALLRSVREGKMRSDFLVFGLHSHETKFAAKPDTDPEPGDFLQGFARKVIDAGADSFVGTGVHVLRGIEIYKGRPIYYGLGELFRQMDINRPGAEGPQRGDANSDPAKYETVIAVNRFEHGKLAEVRLYPVELGANLRMAHRGIPRTASPEAARRILERLQRLSQPYGTVITIDRNVGVIRLADAR